MKAVLLTLDGSLEEGFFCRLAIRDATQRTEVETIGKLPENLEIKRLYQDWRDLYNYHIHLDASIIRGPRLGVVAQETTNVSDVVVRQALVDCLNGWLDSNSFRAIERELLRGLTEQPMRFIIQSEERNLWRLPWREWSLLERVNPEFVFCPSETRAVPGTTLMPTRDRVRMLTILGDCTNINTEIDRQIVEQLPDAETVVLHQPTIQEICEALRDPEGFNLLLFSGHSFSLGDSGLLSLNEKDQVSINNFSKALRVAVGRGLKLAIFNSCESLSFGRDLARLVPQTILMKESIPDAFAQEFLQRFFHYFSQRLPITVAVQQTRDELEHFDAHYPDVTSAPVILQKGPEAFSFLWPSSLLKEQQSEAIELSPELRPTSQSPTVLQPVEIQPIEIQPIEIQPIELQTPAELPVKHSSGAAPLQPVPSLPRSNIRQSILWGMGIAVVVVGIFVLIDYVRSRPQAPSTTSHSFIPAATCPISDLPSGWFTYSGSTTWAPMRAIVDPALQQLCPDYRLRYVRPPFGPSGSGTGIKMLLDGQVDFAHSSRPLEDEEYQAALNRGFRLRQIPVAIDGIAIAVHPQLAILGLTMEQFKAILTGQIQNWQQVGGPDLQITLYKRDDQVSSSLDFLENYILDGEDLRQDYEEVESITAAVRQIARDPSGLYFASASLLVEQCQVKTLALGYRSNEQVSPYLQPVVTPEHCSEQRRNQLNKQVFQDGTYPLTRKLFVVLRQGDQQAAVAGEAYARFLLSPKGQELVEQAGFVRIR
jgi:ABC-type phosphate transport system substrate-binding protein